MQILDFLLKSCETYGLFTVFICMLLFLAFILLLKSRQLISLLKTIHHIVHHRIDIQKNTLHSVALNKALDSLIYKYGMDRAWIFEYHNGGTNLAGIPFTKISCTHERISVGMKTFGHNCQNIPAGMLAWWNQKILSRDFISMSVKDKIEDFNLMQICMNRGAHHIVATGIFDFDGKIIGFVGGEFCKSERDPNDEDGIKLTLIKIAGITIAESEKKGD